MATITIKEFYAENDSLRRLRIMGEELVREISELNGAPEEKIKEWLLEGSRVYTNFSYFEREKGGVIMAVVKKKLVTPVRETEGGTLLDAWKQAKEQLDFWKKLEGQYREDLVTALFKDAPIGTNNHELPTGETLSCVKKLNYKLDPDTTPIAQQSIYGIIGPDLARRLVKWKPELSLSEYKKLPDNARAIIDKVLTITPATPSLELKEKKG